MRAALRSIPAVEQPTEPIAIPSDSIADTAREMGFTYEDQATGELPLESLYGSQPDEYVSPQHRPDQTAEMPAISDSSSKPHDFRAPEIPEKRKRTPFVIAVLAIIAALAGASIALYSFGIIGGPLVPDVVGMSVTSAQSVLSEKGLSTEIKQVKSDETEGTVLLTDPSAKSHISKGGTVILHVATPRSVPALTGKSLEEAQELLAEEGLSAVTVQKVKSDEEESIVLQVSPSEGEKVKANTPITIVVSEPYKVPDVSEMTADEAQAAIEAEGLTAVFESTYTTDVPEGSVVSIEPAAGTTVKSGSQVTVYIAKDRGKELVSLAQGILTGEITISGRSYEISSLDSVSYAGNDTVQFSVTARAFTYLDGEKVYGSYKTVEGAIYFDESNSYTIS